MLLQRLVVPSGIRLSLSGLSRKSSSASAFTRCSPYRTQPERKPKKVSDPLRILFCGSDVFSCYSLKALHAEHKANPGLIKSIDVMVRPGKAVGRGYKEIRQVPIQNLAEELSLPIHVRDTFTGWSLPQNAGPHGEPINLIVAVSFGLFVPPRILGQAKYGGLNVHPSLLPDLRGPAPLHHTLLNRLSHTGVSVQTLSPQTFDAGTVIAQTPLPGIPIPQNCTVQQLHDLLAPLGAEMLVSALREGRHILPLVPVVDNRIPDGTEKGGKRYTHAPKITKSDQRLSFLRHSASEAALRARVCGGSLWTTVYLPVTQPKQAKGSKSNEPTKIEIELPINYPHPLEESTKGSPKRIILEDISELSLLPSETAEDATLTTRYESYQALLRSLNSDTNTSSYSLAGSASTSTLQQILNTTFLPSPPSSPHSDASDPLFWLLRFSEDNEYVDVNVNVDVETTERTERKPRVSWGLCTRLGLDDNGNGKNEEDKDAVTFVMSNGGEDDGSSSRIGLLRVGKIKVEGKGSKPARQVVRELAVKVC